MKNKANHLLLLGIILIAFNLRAPITSVGSVVALIQEDYSLTSSTAGFLTTLPLLAFAFFSPFVSTLSGTWGYGKTVFIGLVFLLSGELIRSYTNLIGLFVGTLFIGLGIAIGNVLIPSLIKGNFGNKVGVMTSIYTTSMCILAAVGSGISAPLAISYNLGWNHSLAIWTILTFVTAVLWLPHLKEKTETTKAHATEEISVWRSPLAWWVTLFMGTQSLLFYSLIAWLPTIITSRGMTAEFAGMMSFWFQLISLPATLIIPIIAGKQADQRKITLLSTISYLLGMILFSFANTVNLTLVSLTLIGVGVGGSISLALAFIGLRSPNREVAAKLSGMSQSAGYLLAAIGPSFIGYLFDVTASWTLPLGLFLCGILFLMVFGWEAGKDQTITANTPNYTAELSN